MEFFPSSCQSLGFLSKSENEIFTSWNRLTGQKPTRQIQQNRQLVKRLDSSKGYTRQKPTRQRLDSSTGWTRQQAGLANRLDSSKPSRQNAGLVKRLYSSKPSLLNSTPY